MVTRTTKILLLAGLGLFYALVVFNNLTDFDSNYQFVRHVLSMDTTFPGKSCNVPRPGRSPGFISSPFIFRLLPGKRLHALLWWGADPACACPTFACGRIQCRKARTVDCPDPLAHDVADCFFGDWRRVVPYVAIEDVEWAGSRIPGFRRCGIDLSDPDATGHRRAKLGIIPESDSLFSWRSPYHASPAAI